MADIIPEDETLKAPATEKKIAPPPSPPAWLYTPVAPPEPHVVGANAEPYSHTPFLSEKEAPPPCDPPPPEPLDEAHVPEPALNPPPSAEIVPPTKSVPLLVNATLPDIVIEEPGANKNEFVALTKPFVIVHAVVPDEPSDSVLFATIELHVFNANVLVPSKTPSETKNRKLLAIVRDPSFRRKYQNRTVDALLPRVLAVELIVVVIAWSVTFRAAPRAPSHTSAAVVNVVTGGTHSVDPDAIVIDTNRVVISGVDKYAHKCVRALRDVYFALVVDATNVPEAVTVWTSSFAPRLLAIVALQP